MKSAIVTGANGFIGRWLVEKLLEENVKVYAIVKDENEEVSMLTGCNIVYCELSEILTLTQKITEPVDVFYHLAWAGAGGAARADYSVQLANAKFSCDAANCAKMLGCKKFLCAGTITEKIAENILNIDVKAENTIYALEKHNTHCLLDILCKKIELDYVWMRFSNVYGPYNMSGNIISYMLGELMKGNRPSFSKGEQPYDLIYIKDLVNAVYLLGKKDTKKNCYFIGSGNCRMLRDYLTEIKDMYGNGAEIGLGERPDDGLKYYKEWFEISDLCEDTGFKPEYAFEDAIKETIDWIKGVY